MDDDKPQNVTLNTIRTPKTRDWFAIARKTAQDDSLSFEARGVLFYLLSKPDDWIIRTADIVNNSGKRSNGKPNISKRKAESLLTELRNAGYLHTEYTRERGRFTSKVERLYDVPQSNITATSKNRSAVKPQRGKTVLRFSAHIHNTESLQETESLQPIAPAIADARGASDLPSADTSSKPVKVKAKKEPKPRERNPLFDAVALHLFSIPEGTTVTQGARIGKVVNVCKAHDVTGETLPAFVAWYKREYPQVSLPRDAAKIEEHLIKWQAQRKTGNGGGWTPREYTPKGDA
jgi:hypothetical protein